MEENKDLKLGKMFFPGDYCEYALYNWPWIRYCAEVKDHRKWGKGGSCPERWYRILWVL